MREEIENPMLSPAPPYNREQRREFQIDLSDHHARMDAWNRKMAEQSREAAKRDTKDIA